MLLRLNKEEIIVFFKIYDLFPEIQKLLDYDIINDETKEFIIFIKEEVKK